VLDAGNDLARPTDADLEYAAQVLQAALSNRDLSWNEYEDRLSQAFEAATLAELRAVLGALPPSTTNPTRHRTPSHRRLGPVQLIIAVGILIGAALAVVTTSVDHRSPAAGAYQTPGSTPAADDSIPPASQSTPTANSSPVAASCARSVPYEQTEPIDLNRQYSFLLPTNPAACVALAGLQYGPRSPDAAYYHLHIDIDLMGGQSPIAQGIGLNPATREVTGIFTESDTGIVWFTKNQRYTLGQLFLEWGQPLSATQIGAMRINPDYPLTWYVNGTAVSNPATIVLHNHDEIEAFEDLASATVKPQSSFDWPPGY
jgi:Domain of unknown function (DUF1707)